MRRLVGLLLCAFVVYLSSPAFALDEAGLTSIAKDLDQSQANLNVSRTTPELTTISLNSPVVETQAQTIDYQTYQSFGIAGEYSVLEEGSPTVPAVSRFYRIPNTGGAELDITDAEYDVVDNVNCLPVQPEESGFRSLTRNEGIYAKDEWYPANVAVMSDPMIMRDFRVVSVTLYPVQVNPVTHQARIYRNLSVNLVANNQPGQNELLNPRRPSGAWAEVYRSQIANLDEGALDDMTTTPGSIIILTRNDSIPRKTADSLAVWKTRKGYKVTIDNRATWTASQAYTDIHNAYLTADPPLEYAILMGDPGATWGIPVDGGNFDHTYGNMTAGDNIEDIGVGRLSAGTDAAMACVRAKIMQYERDPHMQTGGGTADTTWYHKAFLYAGVNRGMTSNYLLMRWGKDQFERHTAVDSISVLTHANDNIVDSDVTTRINAGIAFFLWRGSWIFGMSNSIADGTNPGGRLPITMTVTCQAGEYTGSGINSPAEDFLCAGTVQNPAGGVCGMGTSTSGTENGPNGVIASGLVYSIANLGIEHLGTAVSMAKSELYTAYGPTYPDAEDPSQPIALKFTHLFNLLGDPSLSMWTDVPRVLNVTHPTNLNVGARSVDVTVTQEADGAAVDNALVVLWKPGSDSTWVRGLTNSQGHITLPVSVNTPGSMYLTITKRNCKPYLFTIPCGQVTVMPMVSSWTLDDDNSGGSQGNGDHILNPGETIDLSVYIRNFGTGGAATNLSATMTCDNPNITVVNGTATYANLASGDSATGSTPFRIHVSPNIQNREQVQLRVAISSDAGPTVGVVPLTCAAGEPVFQSSRISTPAFNPGTTTNLTVVVKNVGAADMNGVTGHLTPLTPFVRVTGADASFGNIPIGALDSNATTAFVLYADSQTFRGLQAPMRLVLTATGGFADTTDFIISVGTANASDPTGPDAYGYYAYDNTDTAYEMHPTFSYVNIAQNGGTNLNIQDRGDKINVTPIYSAVVRLPFRFKFYGQFYDSLTICSNGWCAFGNQSYLDMFRNYPIPGMGDPDAMIAPYFDDLRTDSAGFGVWVKADTANHRYIVQWKALGYSNSCLVYGTVSPGDYHTPLDFEVMLYDTIGMPTLDGSGVVVMQYNQVTMNITPAYCDEAPGCTIGIQKPGNLVGLQYAYQASYSPGAATVVNGRAILFTTEARQLTGIVQGTIRDAANNQPMPGVYVSLDGAPYHTVTDNSGFYQIPEVVIGLYTVRAAYYRYNDATTTNVLVELDSTETVDMAMHHPQMTLSTNAITDTVNDTPVQTSFTISNIGNGTLDYSTGVFFHGDPSPDPWDSVGSVDITGTTGDGQSWGCEYFRNQWWATGTNGPGGQKVLYRFDDDGNYLGWIPQPSTTASGWFDLATDGTMIYGSDSHVLYGVDAEGQVQDTIPSPLNPSRAIAYDPLMQHFFVADYVSSIYEIDRMGNTVQEIPNSTALNITGLAWHATDADGFKLYVLSRDGANEMHISKINTGTHVLQSVVDLHGLEGEHAAGCTITPDWNSTLVTFAAVLRGPTGSRIALHEMRFTSSWMNVSPASANIPGPGSQGVTLTFNSGMLRDATYHVDIRISSVLYDSTMVLPITLVVHHIESAKEHPVEIPTAYALRQNFPNPFNPTTQIAFDLPHAEHVQLYIYNALGQKVATVLNEMRAPGSYVVTWDGRSGSGADLSTGVYFCQLTAGNFTAVKKMLLMR
jgi:hypothetical protein